MQKNRFLCFVISFFVAKSPFLSFCQSHISTQAHSGTVTNVDYIENSDGAVFSSGNDGFIIKWTEDGMGEHYQISDLPIKMIARSPDGNEIAVYETNGASLNRVSVWNWKTFTRKFAFRFTDSLTSLAYSAKGTYIICGTASVSGAFFLNASKGTIIRNKIKENTGVVNFIQTSDSEKSIIMYSPKGSLVYYDLQTGEQKKKFNTEYELEQFCLFNNMVFCAGVRDNKVFVIQAVTGDTIGSYNAQNPILVSSNESKDLYYIVNEGRQFKVFKIANVNNKSVAAPVLQRTFSGLKSGEMIVCAELAGEEIYAGTNTGNIYKFDYVQAERVDVQMPVTDKMYDKIYDIAAVGEDFYFLTPSSIFKSSYDSSNIEKKASNTGYANIISYGENIILWSKDTKKPVVLLELASGRMTQLFVPSGVIQVLKLYGNSLIDVESNSSVNLFDIEKSAKREIYKGTGIQDAILFNENDLYVAKTGGSSSPMVCVNVNTQETVPLKMNGNIAYSLSYDSTKSTSEFYGITIYTNSQTKKLTTSIFAYKPQSKSTRYLLSINDEDNEAFAYLSNNILYTNIGKTQIRSYNISSRRDFLYKRSASMPVKIVQNRGKLVVLNRDGSISWYNPNLNSVLSDWYLTSDGNWFEF